jgi:mannose-6-phosphate isomerase-like protein (cupin superfamily)
MQIIDWHTALTTATTDAKAGIAPVRLTGDTAFATHLARLEAGQTVTAHYHRHGAEHYHILSGQGRIAIRALDQFQFKELPVRAGHSFLIPANTWHSLTNCANEPLLLMFSCPASHLDSDRYTG